MQFYQCQSLRLNPVSSNLSSVGGISSAALKKLDLSLEKKAQKGNGGPDNYHEKHNRCPINLLNIWWLSELLARVLKNKMEEGYGREGFTYKMVSLLCDVP